MKEANIDWSVKLQEKNLLFGDFIKTYLEMILVVKKEADKYHISKLLLQSLNQRKDNLLQNPTVAAAIYLDPRLRRLLHSPEFAPLKSVAVAHLKALYLKIHGNDNNTQEPAANSSSEVHEDSDNLLGTLLNQISQYEPRSENTTEAFSIIEAFNENCDLKANLADYWESKKFTHSTLYQLYKIIHATPATQVSVERAFSTLKYIINDYRSGLSDDITEAILMLRLN
ncbi:uncharacterized protein LOC118735155 isoform X2 [Rhagoletis pomonella]|uniref:uncharacterized protein LOC118735155 isoform X2 n=1 Tax=Rhagoletis pomonella TaxID=28610 RepID=UPI00178061BB|nr:uncharacterized protein LOC118735155 isoform X2 [Rhagoletis pomonella]